MSTIARHLPIIHTALHLRDDWVVRLAKSSARAWEGGMQLTPLNEEQEQRWASLTPKELEIAEILAQNGADFTYKEVAKQLTVSVRTVHRHREHIFEKLDIHEKTTLVRQARARGMGT